MSLHLRPEPTCSTVAWRMSGLTFSFRCGSIPGAQSAEKLYVRACRLAPHMGIYPPMAGVKEGEWYGEREGEREVTRRETGRVSGRGGRREEVISECRTCRTCPTIDDVSLPGRARDADRRMSCVPRNVCANRSIPSSRGQRSSGSVFDIKRTRPPR